MDKRLNNSEEVFTSNVKPSREGGSTKRDGKDHRFVRLIPKLRNKKLGYKFNLFLEQLEEC